MGTEPEGVEARGLWLCHNMPATLCSVIHMNSVSAFSLTCLSTLLYISVYVYVRVFACQQKYGGATVEITHVVQIIIQ